MIKQKKEDSVWKRRKQKINKSLLNEYDLIIIGGGITGAGAALDAASRGLSVLLLEKNDFASGTSSRSTKLIHGGLRYLKQLEFALIKETGRERSIIHHLAPHLVVPEKMLLPITETGEYGKILTSLGLGIYDYLAGVKGEDRKEMISAKKTQKLEPMLSVKGLNGSAVYSEYRTDDARLVLANILTAERYGATCLSYMEVKDFVLEDDKITSVVAKDIQSGESLTYHAKQVVSATGPWVEKVLGLVDESEHKRMLRTKGVHLVFPYDKLPVQQSIYFEVGDGRMIFAIPRGAVTYLGTTDTFYSKSIDKVKVSQKDVSYLLDAANNAFKKIKLKPEDIISSWAGLRSLAYEEGKDPSELSRKDEIHESESGLISIFGGKLTGYRKMAERLIDIVVERSSKKKVKKCSTEKIALTSNPFKDYKEVKNAISKLAQKLKGLPHAELRAKQLVHLYGQPALDMIDKVKKSEEKEIEEYILTQEIRHAVQHEHVYTLEDYIVRRSAMLYFDPMRLQEYKKHIVQSLGQELQWSEEQNTQALDRIKELLKEVSEF